MKKYLKIVFQTILRLFLVVAPILVIWSTRSGEVIYDRIKLDDGTKMNLYKEVPTAIVITAIIMFVLILVYVGFSLYMDIKLLDPEKRTSSKENTLQSISEEYDEESKSEAHNKRVKIFRIINIVTLLFILAFAIYYVTFFSIKQDDRNMYPWSSSLAVIIITVALISYNIYLIYKPEKELEKPAKINPVKALTEGSIAVAMSVTLSVISDLIPGLRLPNGGGVSLSLLPLFIYAFRNGAIKGAMVGFVYSIVNFIIDGYVIHWGSIFFDYLLPFTGAALIVGLFSKKVQNSKKLWTSYVFLTIAVILGGAFRYVMHSLSGMLFFAEWAPEGMNAAYYSFVYYNLPYMAAVTGATLLFALLLNKRLVHQQYRAV